MRRRVGRLERAVGRPSDIVLPIVTFDPEEEETRRKIAEAEERGWRVHLIVVRVADRQPRTTYGEDGPSNRRGA